jgi:hypothetical protein
MNNLESWCNPRGRLSALCGRQLLSPGRTLGKYQANGRQYSQSDRNSEKGTPHAYGIGCDRRHFGRCRWWFVLSLSSPPEGSRTAPYSLDRSRMRSAQPRTKSTISEGLGLKLVKQRGPGFLNGQSVAVPHHSSRDAQRVHYLFRMITAANGGAMPPGQLGGGTDDRFMSSVKGPVR